MATANFGTMKYDMPLIVGGFYDENDPDWEWHNYEEVECIKEDLADFNDTLKHFELGIEAGYCYDHFEADPKYLVREITRDKEGNIIYDECLEEFAMYEEAKQFIKEMENR